MASDGDFSTSAKFDRALHVPKAPWLQRFLIRLMYISRPLLFLAGMVGAFFGVGVLSSSWGFPPEWIMFFTVGGVVIYVLAGFSVHKRFPDFSPFRITGYSTYIKVPRRERRSVKRRIRNNWVSTAVLAGLAPNEALAKAHGPFLKAVVRSAEGMALYVTVPAGGSASTLIAKAPNVASAIGVRQLLAAENHQLLVKFVIPARDALEDTVSLRDALDGQVENKMLASSIAQRPVPSIVFGTTGLSECVSIPLDASQHYAFQGQARSGKSVGMYGFLSQLRSSTNWLITGIDPTGALPAATDEIPWVLAGAGGIEPSEVARWLDDVEQVLNSRLVKLRCNQSVDKFEADDPEFPVLLVVLEEFPGVLKSMKVAEAGVKPADRVTDRLKAVYGRLLMEALKVNIRVLTIAQRADAEVLGGAERAQIACRVTFKVDNQDAVRMFHDGVTGHEWDQLRNAAPGVGVIEQIGQRRTMFRAFNTGFTEYRALAGDMPPFNYVDAGSEELDTAGV